MSKIVNITTDPGADAATISAALATRLRQYRQQQKLSLDELSRRAGVSKGMLVEIEKGNANPSIAILCKLAAALGVAVADIVNVASAPPIHLIAAADIPVLWTGPGGGSARLLAGSSGPDMVELWRWEMHPGEVFSSPGHPQGTFELFHVEQGEMQLRVGDTVNILPAGHAAVARTDAPHHYANASDDLLVFTMTVAELSPLRARK